jgi:Pyrimidine dimer DNA glycosylase
MRLWTVHPELLDSQGLVALWREALLARAVLRGRTRGYKSHPQLVRFRAAPHPVRALNAYLAGIYAEALNRGYHFDVRKLGRADSVRPLPATRGQLAYEWSHLRRKLRQRNPAWLRSIATKQAPRAHPLFRLTQGPVSPWERVQASPTT